VSCEKKEEEEKEGAKEKRVSSHSVDVMQNNEHIKLKNEVEDITLLFTHASNAW
jgi:hypothetical protein